MLIIYVRIFTISNCSLLNNSAETWSVMAASTVLRIKRRIEENPQDALLIMCKRTKPDTEELSPSLFVFRESVDNQETPYVKKILPKTDMKTKHVCDVEDIMDKMRKEKKELTSKSRYEIVKCTRGLKDVNCENSNDVLNLIDMVKVSDNDEDIPYTYDLYTSWKEDFDITMIDNFVGIETDFIFDSYRDPQQGVSHSSTDDDDDSNDENNWRNDYPDSEGSSINEEDMVRAMERVDIENDLSSDEGEDKIYDDPSVMYNEDVMKYGEAYAKYKAKVLTANPDLASKSLVQCNPTEGHSYKDDSDIEFYYGEEENCKQFDEDDSTDGSNPD